MTPVEIVQSQVEAYNQHDLEAFAAAYGETITMFRMPAAESAISGKAQLKAFYATNRFNLPALKAEILSRMVLGNKVVDHERITGVRDQPFEVVIVYEVGPQTIERVWSFPAD